MAIASDQTTHGKGGGVAPVVARNIDELVETQNEAHAARSIQERMIGAITALAGSIPFVYSQAVLFIVWIGANLRLFGLPAFDPYPFGLLTTIVSLEAIFLSIFVLITQNRMAEMDRKRADLDLQVNLLAEHEVTRLLVMMDAIAEKLEVPREQRLDAEELKEDVSPKQVMEELERPASDDAQDAASGDPGGTSNARGNGARS